MKANIKSAVILTLLMFVLVSVIYPVAIRLVAYLGPNQGRGETAVLNGKVVGYANIGQKFTLDKYFWGRPSAVDYNAAGSGGSNKGPSNSDLLLSIQQRIDTFLKHNPDVKVSEIPSELVTASASGLDPDISPTVASIQIKRVAKARNITEEKVASIVKANISGPLLGFFGPSKVNVLKLNIALDNLK